MEERLKDLTTHFEFQEVFSKELAQEYASESQIEMSPSLSASILSVPSELDIPREPILTPSALDVSLSGIQLFSIQIQSKEATIDENNM